MLNTKDMEDIIGNVVVAVVVGVILCETTYICTYIHCTSTC